MSTPKILLQLDTDPQPSVFDSVVAVDSGVEHLFRHGGITPENVIGLVHGAIFTRSPSQLKQTGIFIGGSDAQAGDRVARVVLKNFFGPLRTSVMIDSNGSNTTAAAAVLTAGKHAQLAQAKSVVLGATGPVGRRAAALLLHLGGQVCVTSRSAEKLQELHAELTAGNPDAANRLQTIPWHDTAAVHAALHSGQVLIAAGAAGVTFFDHQLWQLAPELQVAIDLNAVPPLGLTPIQATDKAKPMEHCVCYGALGVGGLKMKIHQAALQALFESNEQLLDTHAIFTLAQTKFA